MRPSRVETAIALATVVLADDESTIEEDVEAALVEPLRETGKSFELEFMIGVAVELARMLAASIKLASQDAPISAEQMLQAVAAVMLEEERRGE